MRLLDCVVYSGRSASSRRQLAKSRAPWTNADDADLLRGHPVHEPVAKHKDLAESGLPQLGHKSAPVGKGLEARSGFKCPDQDLDGLVPGIVRDVGDDFVERDLGRFGPDYGAVPRSHLRRNSASTWAWGTMRPSATSASTRETAWTTYRWYRTSSILQLSGSRSSDARTVSMVVIGRDPAIG